MMLDDFREAYWWLRDTTPEDARVMAWWDFPLDPEPQTLAPEPWPPNPQPFTPIPKPSTSNPITLPYTPHP
jgi:hypothetical protein